MKKFTSISQKIGELGEEIACKYLESKGYSVLERNYTRKWGEIDIIASKENSLYFIEVKSKSVSDLSIISQNETGGRPEDNMHPWKLKRLSRVVQTYLINKRIGNTLWQFDLLVVYIDIESRKARVRKIENVIL
jgi:putative endonuclease